MATATMARKYVRISASAIASSFHFAESHGLCQTKHHGYYAIYCASEKYGSIRSQEWEVPANEQMASAPFSTP
jgi:hypothetical protein